MRAFLNVCLLVATFLLMNTILPASENLAVPGQVQFAGRIEAGNLSAEGAEATEVKAGVRGVMFSLFAEQSGGAALWVESQNVAVSGDGGYNTLLGAETQGGIPQSIFASGEARWLEVSYTGADGATVTQPRVLLVSVPYALKAGDAATLGGLPASAFVLNADAVASRVSDNGGLPGATVTDVLPSAAVTAGRIAKFNSALATDVVDSIITESAGKIGIGTTTPMGTIDVGGWASIPGDIQGVGSTISGDVFMGNTNGGIGRFRMASNALQGFFSWNQYYNGTNHKGMDATAPGWRVNIGGTGAEDAYYVERSPATANGHVPARLFVVNGNGRVGINTGTAAPLGTLDVGGWPAIPIDIQGVGTTISGDVFMGNTNGGIGRYRMASNALQGFFSWNQYYNGVGHKGMDATAPGWRINVGGTGIEDAFYVERSPATADLHAPARLFQVSGSGNVGIGTTAPTAKFHVVGNSLTTGTATVGGFTLNVGASLAGKVLTSDANGVGTWQTPAGGGGGISGSGTANKLPKFTGATTLGDSQITDNGTDVTIGVNGGGLAVLASATSPSIRAGYSGNAITTGVVGATISGGGQNANTNRVTDDFGVIGGGRNNQAGNNAGTTVDRPYATVAGGIDNTASGGASTVGGGGTNTASGANSSVGGGAVNLASGLASTVSGGSGNLAVAELSTVGGGTGNQASGQQSTVGGGGGNWASGNKSSVSGGSGNEANGLASVIGGGESQLVTDDYGTVGGGNNNQAGDNAGTIVDRSGATVAGGMENTASGSHSSVGGGKLNVASASYSTVSGGWRNEASGQYAAIGGGVGNIVSGAMGTIAGGGQSDLVDSITRNRVTDDYGTIGGGGDNQAGDNAGSTTDKPYATVGGGLDNMADGSYSTVSGGTNNRAGERGAVPGGSGNSAGTSSFAAGTNAKAYATGSFVWADSTGGDFVDLVGNRFLIRAQNGVGINTAGPVSALDVNGTITADGFTLQGNGAGAGKVLTSDASGNASWSAAGSGSVTSITAGTGLTASPGSPITTTGTLSFNETYGDGRYARLAADNNFTGRQVAMMNLAGSGAVGSAERSVIVGVNTEALSGNVGVYGESQSNSGSGVRGIAGATPGSSGTANGVWGTTLTQTGRGVYGNAGNSFGINSGVYGESASDEGAGVRGVATHIGSALSYGVRGQNNGTAGTGVLGDAPCSVGCGATFGVKGQTASTSGAAGFFQNTNAGGRSLVAATSAGADALTVLANGNVGIGTSTPLMKLEATTATGGAAIWGNHTAASGSFVGVWGQSNSTHVDASGIRGDGTIGVRGSGVTGVYGTSGAVSAKGVHGRATLASGVAYGGYFEAESSNLGSGVFAVATSASAGIGVHGRAGGGGDSVLVFEDRVGVFGESTNGKGVYGTVSGEVPITYGVYGESGTSQGTGVYGSGSTGVRGSSSQTGVYGSGGTYGVRGESGLSGGAAGFFQNTNAGGRSLVAATSAGADALTVLASGNVGVGTAAPTAKLHVAGTSGIDGIRFPDGTLQTTAAAGGGGGAATDVNCGAPCIATAEIVDSAITTAKLADVAVDGSKILAGSVTTNHLADGAATSAKIFDNTITNADVSPSAAIAVSKIAGAATLGANSFTGGQSVSTAAGQAAFTGQHTAGSGANYGGIFTTASTLGIGLFSEATASSGITYGGYFRANSSQGTAGYFQNTNSAGTGLRVETDTTAPAFAVRASGNVGVGTDTPGSKFHITGAESTTNGKAAAVQLSNSAAGGNNWYLRAGATGTGTPAGGLSIADDAGYRMVIESSGDVGIGTLTPGSKLEVFAGDPMMRVRNSNDTGGAFLGNTFSTLQLGLYNPSGGAWGTVAAGQVRSFFGIENSGKVGSLTNDFGGPAFRNLLDDGSGNAGFGTTSPADKVHIVGNIRITGQVRDGNGTCLANCPSDARFKSDIQQMEPMLERLLRLRPVRYDWRRDEFPERGFPSARTAGLIAQEVAAVLPELVTHDEKGFQGVAYHQLPLLTVQALKELKAENDKLQSEVSELREMLMSLQRQLGVQVSKAVTSGQ